MVKEQHPQAVKEATENILPVWLDTFKEILGQPVDDTLNQPTWDGLAVRIQVFKVSWWTGMERVTDVCLDL